MILLPLEHQPTAWGELPMLRSSTMRESIKTEPECRGYCAQGRLPCDDLVRCGIVRDSQAAALYTTELQASKQRWPTRAADIICAIVFGLLGAWAVVKWMMQ